MESKRPLPTSRILKTRTAILKSYLDMTPIDGEYFGFEYGNKKTGCQNHKGQRILIWNLPPIVTCPGADNCKVFCYNADTRANIFPVEKWCINWYWANNKIDDLVYKLDSALKAEKKPIVRIHSSGDFFSSEYIKMWIDIANNNPHALFWAYTRSWRVPSLIQNLNDLYSLNNVNLFASLSAKDDIPPEGWRTCLVGRNMFDPDLYNCPEQYNGGIQCIECGYCFGKDPQNVYFVMH